MILCVDCFPFSHLSQLTNVDEVMLILIRLTGLCPSRGCDPDAKSNAPLVEAIDVRPSL